MELSYHGGFIVNHETLTFDTANGPSSAFVAIPEKPNGKAVVVVQEWWGLNAHIKDIADRYAREGFIAIAPDLYRGKLAADPTEAGELMNALAIDDGLDTIENAMSAASTAYDVSIFGITGYCMGGTFALRSACELENIGAAAAFYGDTPPDDVLKKLTVPTIFISGTRDAWINPEKVAALETVAERYSLPIESIAYDADHAFFNDTRPEVYDANAAADAWERVIALFNVKL